ncbi:MAG: phosphodiester glycosidase family protein [Muribaculaceae bacterium]|nr:phosphodiester glycosidase family protein [Muribaculaceae bacterium]
MKKMTLLAAMGAIALCGRAENTIKIGDENFYADTLIHVTVGPGMQTTGIRISGADKSNASVKTNVFYTSVDINNPNLVLTGVQARDEECASENLLTMGNRKNQQRGLQYIAGVNGDHANLNGEHKRTNGITYIDDCLYNWGIGDTGWKTFESYVTVEGAKDILISDNVKFTLPIKFPNGRENNIHINTQRNEGYLVLYTPEYGTSTKTNEWGKECTLKLVSGSIIGCDAVFEVTSEPVGECNGNTADGNMTIPADGYVLSGVGMMFSQVNQLKIGDRIEMQPVKFTINRKKVTDVTTIVGGCPVIVDNGTAISSSECDKLNKTTAIQITPTARTAIGYNEDKTRMFLVVADSYKSNDHTSGDKASYGATSSGMNFETLAKFMIYLGCHTATAMDGGGSSQLYNIGLGICNIPYGLASYLRPVANGFFAANDTPEDNDVAAIEVLQKNVRLNTGESFTPKVYGYNKYGVLVKTDISDFSLTVSPECGAVSGTTLTASDIRNTTTAVVSYGDIKCGVRLILNGGGPEIGPAEEVNIEVRPPYLADDPAAVSEIIVDDPSATGTKEYYNLQGLPISQPAKGFYIVRHGSQAQINYKF